MAVKFYYRSIKVSSNSIFADFEETLVVPAIDYLYWVKSRGAPPEVDEIYRQRRQEVTANRTEKSWINYLSMYTGLMNIGDFGEMANGYSLNPKFVQWAEKFRQREGYKTVVIDVLTKGFDHVVKLYFGRSDVQNTLSSLGVEIGQIIGAECEFQNGVLSKVSRAIYAKRPLVKDGYIMLGDNDEVREFGKYEHFVNLSTWEPSSNSSQSF